MSSSLDTLRQYYAHHVPGLLNARHSYAVLCPLLEKSDGLHLLYEVRARGLRQGGEVCFPGGRQEAGESAVDCALRETCEELSIPPDTVEVLGTPDFICNQRGFLLQPVLGIVAPAGIAALVPSPDEVAEVFTVPLDFFRNNPPQVYTYDLAPQVPGDFPYAAVGVSPDYPWSHGKVEVPIWHWQQHPIWGMTARLTADLVRSLS